MKIYSLLINMTDEHTTQDLKSQKQKQKQKKNR